MGHLVHQITTLSLMLLMNMVQLHCVLLAKMDQLKLFWSFLMRQFEWFSTTMNFKTASIGDLKVPNKLGIQPCFVPSFLYETFLHSLACLEHIKLSCRTPFTKICLFRGGFSTGILISHNGFTLSASYESLYQSTCVIHVNQIEFTYLHVKYYSK